MDSRQRDIPSRGRRLGRRALTAARAWAGWLVTRPGSRPPHRILVSSLPKSGTTLVLKSLLGMPGLHPAPFGLTNRTAPAPRANAPSLPVGVDWPQPADSVGLRRRIMLCAPGSVAIGHVPHSRQMAEILERTGARLVAVLRDPRDVATSLPPYVMAHPEHFLHARFATMDPADRLMAAIRGLDPDAHGHGLLPLSDRVASILAWRDEPTATLVRFEDLVGAHGGGSDDAQRRAIHQLATHVGRPLSATQAAAIAEHLFGGTSTFRQGRIGAWSDAFAGSHHQAVREVLGDMLSELGYKENGPWAT